MKPLEGPKRLVVKFRLKYYANLNELIYFFSPWNHPKSYKFLINSRGIEANPFALTTFFNALQRNAKNVWTIYFYDILPEDKCSEKCFYTKH